MPLNINYSGLAAKAEHLSSVNLNPLTNAMKDTLRFTHAIPQNLPIDAILFDKHTAVTALTYELHKKVCDNDRYGDFKNSEEGILYIELPQIFSPGYLTLTKNKENAYYSVTTVDNESVMYRYALSNLGDRSLDAIIQYSAMFGTIPLEVLKKVSKHNEKITIVKNTIKNTDDLDMHDDTKAWTISWNKTENCIEIYDVNLGNEHRKEKLEKTLSNSSEVFFIIEKSN